jgi:hypothetical protein
MKKEHEKKIREHEKREYEKKPHERKEHEIKHREKHEEKHKKPHGEEKTWDGKKGGVDEKVMHEESELPQKAGLTKALSFLREDEEEYGVKKIKHERE